MEWLKTSVGEEGMTRLDIKFTNNKTMKDVSYQSELNCLN